MKILYFAWVRTQIGKSEETLTPPAEVRTVGQLLDWLATQGPAYASALAKRAVIKVAINQESVEEDAAISTGDEIALFPPVTGG